MNTIKVKDLPLEAKIKLGKYAVEDEIAQPIIWIKADQDYKGYPDNATTLTTEKIIDLRAFDARERTNPNGNARRFGDNRWKYSNIRQWLNSDKIICWYNSQHKYDCSPIAGMVQYETEYHSKWGFLHLWTNNEKSLLLDTYTEDECMDKVFFFSEEEVGAFNNNGRDRIAIFRDYYNRTCWVTNQLRNNTGSTHKPSIDSRWHWWLRTSCSDNYYGVWTVYYDAMLTCFRPYNGSVGIRPVVNIDGDILVYDTPDDDECYNIVFEDNNKLKGYTKKQFKKIGEMYKNICDKIKNIDNKIDYMIYFYKEGGEINYKLVVENNYEDMLKTCNDILKKDKNAIKFSWGYFEGLMWMLTGKDDLSCERYGRIISFLYELDEFKVLKRREI